MKKLFLSGVSISLILIVGLLAACQPDDVTGLDPTGIPGEASPPLQPGQLRQWAAESDATSEFADPEWSAGQAVGEPDTDKCGDYQTAWATAASDSIETLTLGYLESVYVTGVNIVQSFNPNQIVKVELVGVYDRSVTIFEGQPKQIDQPCPYILSIPVEKTEGRFSKVRVTVNQSILGLGWNQIDAVELIGDIE